MIHLGSDTSIFVYTMAVDMRKSIDGLSVLVVEEVEQSPQSGSIYLFCNKSGNKIKVLYWDRNGFIMHYKRLEKGRFKLSKTMEDKHFEINKDQLSWLLAGLDFMLMNACSDLDFSDYF